MNTWKRCSHAPGGLGKGCVHSLRLTEIQRAVDKTIRLKVLKADTYALYKSGASCMLAYVMHKQPQHCV